MIQTTNCSLCGSCDAITYQHNDQHRIMKCKRCGLLYVDPQPTEDELREYYTRIADHQYLLKYKHQSLQRGDKILQLVGRFKADGNLLDVGCGYGFFLDLARKKGWNAYGLELATGAVQYAREVYNLNILQGDINEVPFRRGEFDLISLQHTLEHIPHPILTLRKLAAALKSDGILAVAVPNAASLMARLAGTRWVCFSQASHHLCHYTTRTLELLLNLSGFENIACFTYQGDGRDLVWGMKTFVQKLSTRESSLDSPQAADECRSQEDKQRATERSLTYLSPICWLVAKLGLGAEIISISKKK